MFSLAWVVFVLALCGSIGGGLTQSEILIDTQQVVPRGKSFHCGVFNETSSTYKYCENVFHHVLPSIGISGRISAIRSNAEVLKDIKKENAWKNDLILSSIVPDVYRAQLPSIVESWLRNYVACLGVYFGIGAVWAYYVYYCWGNRLFGEGNMPSRSDVLEQMKVAMWAMPLYATLPAITEWIVEQGWTRAYARIEDVGLRNYFLYFVMYMACVEFFVYCNHRGLHDVKIGYKWLHYIHHKYNKEHTMSPFAGLAFHALDGITQAIPYCFLLFFIPMHFLTHELLLFATGVWTANIHDNVHAGIMPMMGAGYHTLHHTIYNYNYGHYFIYVDWMMGTLVSPEEHAAKLAKKA